MANLEISGICKEFQILLGSKISSIYGLGPDEFRLVFATREGAKEIFARLGVCVHLTRFVRPAPQTPTQLAMLLRKHLENARVSSIGQHEGDRVIVFELEKEQKYGLVFEMFAKGNLVLVGEDGKVLACRRIEEWRDRKTRIGGKYSFPSSAPVTPVENIRKEKGRLMAVLTKSVQVGAIYLEEACARAGLPPSKNADSLDENEIAKLAASVREVVSEDSPRVYHDKESGQPLEYSLCSLSKFKSSSLEQRQYGSLSSALDEFAGEQGHSPVEDKKRAEIEKITRKLEEQERKAAELEKEAEGAKAMGDAIYSNYEKVDEILTSIRDLRKSGHGWDAVREKTGAKIEEKKGKAKVELG